jgi:hypothetical protein
MRKQEVEPGGIKKVEGLVEGRQNGIGLSLELFG